MGGTEGWGWEGPLPAAVHAAKLFVSFSHFHIAFSAHLFFLSTVAADFLGDSVVAWLINLRLISFDFRLSIGWNKDSFSYSLDPPLNFRASFSSADLTLAKSLSLHRSKWAGE